MRHFVFALAVLLLVPGIWAQWSVTAASGPSGFVGSQRTENGVRVVPTGALGASFEASTPLLERLHLTTRAGVGRMGLSAADRALERSSFSTASAGLRVQPFVSKTRKLNPWGAAGIAVLVQQNEMDLGNSMGQAYHFWSDGWIYDMPENHPEAADYARRISRDYAYETKSLRDYAVALPVQAGCDLQLTDGVYGRLAYTLLVGPESSLNPHASGADYLHMAEMGIGVNVSTLTDPNRRRATDDRNSRFADADGDGVRDRKDECPGTPGGVTVYTTGCPTDADGDGVADYLDTEVFSPATAQVDLNGSVHTATEWEQLLAPKTVSEEPVVAYARIESEDPKAPKTRTTAVDATGLTAAERALAASMGGQIEGGKPTATSTTATAAIEPPKVKADALIPSSVPLGAHPDLRPRYRIQLAESVRDVNMDLVNEALKAGLIKPVFDNNGQLRFSTLPVATEQDAERQLAAIQAYGFPAAFVVGDLNGRPLGIQEARLLEERILLDNAASIPDVILTED